MKGICCICTGEVENINQHHISYKDSITVPLCPRCHRKVHAYPNRFPDYQPIDKRPTIGTKKRNGRGNLVKVWDYDCGIERVMSVEDVITSTKSVHVVRGVKDKLIMEVIICDYQFRFDIKEQLASPDALMLLFFRLKKVVLVNHREWKTILDAWWRFEEGAPRREYSGFLFLQKMERKWNKRRYENNS